MLKRTCVTSPTALTSSSNACLASGSSGVRASSSRHFTWSLVSHSTVAPSAEQTSRLHAPGALPLKCRVSISIRRIAPAAPSRMIAHVDRTRLGVVAPEVRRVDVDAADNARHAEPHDAPVVARLATTPRLPTVHPFAALGVLALDPDRGRWLDQVLLRREELVV